jgi:hypothetical protein
MVKAAPGAAFEVVEPYLLLDLLVVEFNAPAARCSLAADSRTAGRPEWAVVVRSDNPI